MKFCTKCKETKELNEFGKDKHTRDGLSHYCKKCRVSLSTKYTKENPEKVATWQRTYRKEHKEELTAYLAAYTVTYYQENKEEIDAYQATYRDENREVLRERGAAFAKANPGKVNANTIKYRTAKLQRTPPWSTKDHFKQIQEVYIEAARLTRETGIPHHVDHIVPLRGKNVSGLHVPWNLQILIGPGPNGNLAKGNKF